MIPFTITKNIVSIMLLDDKVSASNTPEISMEQAKVIANNLVKKSISSFFDSKADIKINRNDLNEICLLSDCIKSSE